MDTSETYIKQCDCPEIQEGHEWNDGDFFAEKSGKRYFVDVCYYCAGCQQEFGGDGGNIKDSSIWLPRQAQLQEMVGDSFIVNVKKIHDYMFSLEAGWNQPQSMEQLWLAFVMKEKFNKTWKGDKWV